MDEKAVEKAPEKEAKDEGTGQDETKGSEGLPRKLGSKVFGMLNKLGKREKDKEPAAVDAGKEGGEASASPPDVSAHKGGAATEEATGAGKAGEGPKEDVMEEKAAESTDDKEPNGKEEEKPAGAPAAEEKEKASEKEEDEPAKAKGGEKTEEPAPEEKDEEKKPPEDEKAPEKDGDKKKPAGDKKEKADDKKKPAGKKGGPAAKGKPAKEERPKESMEELVAHREEIEALLSSIEDSYREATLPDKTYQEVKRKNEKRLDDINHKIKVLESLGVKCKKEGAAVTGAPGDEELGKKEAPAAGRPATPTAAAGPAAPAAQPGKPLAAHMIENLENRIEERLHDVIASASVEVTDKRIRKVDERLDAIESVNKDLKKAAETVAGYDKQFTLMNTEVEKSKAMVESIKEAKNITDDKMQRITESFAEIRSIIYQREAKAKEQEVVIDKLEDTVSQVDTARILREFTTRDEQLRDVNTRLEKIERSSKMLTETMNRIKGLMTDIGSLENIMKGSKHVGEKLDGIQEIEERLKATSARLDSVYVDMKKKLDEFTAYKVKQDKLDGMVADLTKNMEETTRRLTDYATKDDIDMAKNLIEQVREQAKAAASAAAPELSPEVKDLQEEKEEIETLLATIEEERATNKDMSQEEYENAKSNNLLKLKEIDEKIRSYSAPKAKGGKEPGPAGEEGGKHTKAMLLAKLRESYETGVISRAAYEKSKKLLFKK